MILKTNSFAKSKCWTISGTKNNSVSRSWLGLFCWSRIGAGAWSGPWSWHSCGFVQNVGRKTYDFKNK